MGAQGLLHSTHATHSSGRSDAQLHNRARTDRLAGSHTLGHLQVSEQGLQLGGVVAVDVLGLVNGPLLPAHDRLESLDLVAQLFVLLLLLPQRPLKLHNLRKSQPSRQAPSQRLLCIQSSHALSRSLTALCIAVIHASASVRLLLATF